MVTMPSRRERRRAALRRFRIRGRGPRWSVGVHLVTIVAAVVVVFCLVGVYSARETLRNARLGGRSDARFEAGAAVQAASAALTVARAQVAGLVANPNVVRVLADPAKCQLGLSLTLFPKARLDLVAPDGRVVCSSAGGDLPAAGGIREPWLAQIGAAQGTVITAAFIEAATGRPAVVVGGTILDGSRAAIGAVVLVAPTAEVADRLARDYGGGARYQFALIDDATRMVLSTPSKSTVAAPGAAGRPGRDPLAGLLSGSQVIPGTTWRIFAGVRPAVALRSTRSVLAREAVLGAAALVVLLALSAAVYWGIARPLRRLAHAAGDTGPHTGGSLKAVRGPREVLEVAEAFATAISSREAYEVELSHQALHDPLTGLPNRALLADRLARSLEQAGRMGGAIGVLFLDLDRFTVINDSLGHTMGDQVLVAMAKRLAEAIRPGDTLARFGGDEFVVVGHALATDGQAAMLADRLLAAVQAPVEVAGTTVHLTASLGIALASPGSRAAELLRDADTAMHAAKSHGRGRHHTFDAGLRHDATARLTLENALRDALGRDELRVVYQPKVDLITHGWVGVEALLRWDHPTLGAVPPDVFVPVAEETGLIHPLGQFVLEQACRQSAAWRRDGIDLTVAVNISGQQLVDPLLADRITAVLAEAGLTPDRLCLELTESVLMSHAERTARTLAHIHRLGVQLSIDDFGTGYSSLSYLQRFPVDELKIDRVFVNDLTAHPEQRTLITAMVAMGQALGLSIVAEGVETIEQAHGLRVLGCNSAQGYLFAAPQPANTLEPILKERAQVMLP